MKIYINRKTKYFILLFLVAVFIFCSINFACSISKAKADEPNFAVQNFLPQSDLESTQLLNATTVYRNVNLTAIIEDSYLFSIYYNNQVVKISDNINNLKEILEVKLFNNQSLFFSANARLYSLNLNDNAYDIVNLNGSFKEPVSYFDFNSNFLATTYQSVCKIFAINGNSFSSISDKGIEIYNGTNVAINQDGNLFLVGNNGLYKTSASLPAIQTTENTLTTHIPSNIVANNEYIYYIYNSSIYKLSVDGGTPIKFSSYEDDNQYQLGNIVNPKRLVLCGENLLVVQNDSIQEYKIEEDKLVFTGFAIAKNKSAYNRTSTSASEIEKVDNSFGVLDSDRLMIYQENNVNNRYARENYKNFKLENLKIDNVKPTSFTLGESSCLLLYDDITKTVKSMAVLDISSEDLSLSNAITINTNSIIRDICYQSGYYYALCDRGNAPQHIYRAKEGDLPLSFELIDANTSSTEFSIISVDVYGNIYLANKTSISKLSKTDNYTQLIKIIDESNGIINDITKIQTDLLGNLFILSGANIYHPLNQNIIKYDVSNVKSFAFDFVDDKTYILTENKEFISLTNDLDNVSISDLKVPETFSLTNPQGTFKANENLEYYKLIEGANAYIVKPNSQSFVQGDAFKFEALSNYSGEYVQICSINYVSEFLALANQDSIVLIEKSQATKIDDKKDTNVLNKAYVATDVNSYYLPIITRESEYSLNNSSNAVRLDKTTEIYPKFKINFLDCDYYYAEFIYESNTYSGYIPCDFTVEILTDDFKWSEFDLEIIKKTSIYKDDDMQEILYSVEDTAQVRVLDKGNNITKVAFKNQNGIYEIGYVYTKQIVDNSKVAIRNILIIIAVAACVCGSLTYFLLRKKNN